MAVLTLNAGSSSLKFALFEGTRVVLRGAFESITDSPAASVTAADGRSLDPPHVQGAGHEAVLPALFAWTQQHLDGAHLKAVGHRVVHGGDTFLGPVLVDDPVLAGLEALVPFAPLHQPHNIAAIRAAQAAEPGLPQIACFDTAFHQTMPPVARRQALRDALEVRRFGFHGLSYEWIAGHLPPSLAQGRVIIAHLGSGASLCALRAGVSVETTMSTTPLDGLVMGTRCGTLDPGVVLWLVRQHGVKATEHMLYYEAGLLGVSDIGADMRKLHAAGPAAEAAIELFVYRIVQYAGALASVLGGLDGLVFTGGIGEHDGTVRRAVCAKLGWLGIELDPQASAPGRISRPGSAAEAWVIPTDEEAVIARQTARMVP